MVPNLFTMQPGLRGMQDNHFPLFRFAGVLMMKGEAAFRPGDAGTVPGMFNQVRLYLQDSRNPVV